MSSRTPPKIHSSEILHSRYRDLLKGTVPSQIASGLCEDNLLTTEELRTILSFETDVKRHHELLDILSRKGIPMLTKYSAAIKSIKSKPSFSNKLGEAAPSPSSVGCHNGSQGPLALAQSLIPHDHRMEEECQGFPATSNNIIPLGDLQVMSSAQQGIALHDQKVQTGDDGSTLSEAAIIIQGSPATVAGGDSCPHQNGYDVVAAVGSASMNFSTCDHSRELQNFRMDEQHFESKMEALSVLLFTFFSQLRVSLTTRGEVTSEDKQSSSTSSPHHHHNSAGASKNQLSWITLDVDCQSIRDYFPAEFVKGVNPSAEHLIPLRLSVLLDAFQQLIQKYKKLLQDNESMQSELKCLPELVQQKSILEAELREREGGAPSSRGAESQHAVAGYKLQRLQSLERAYVNAEERCKQLVEVTQQWSAECADKDKLIAVQATQIEQVSGELDKTLKRLSKYKKHWMATKDAPPMQRVPDAQFEELRLELACRRELHDQVVAERDEAQKRIVQLNAEIDELKDLVEELRDRLSNLKVQAQAKEPTVREMSHALEENRKMREEIEQLRRTCAEQSDKLLAYETYVNDLTSQGGRQLKQQQQQQQAPPPAAGTATSTGTTRPRVMMSSSSNQPNTAAPPAANGAAVPRPKPKKASRSQQAMVTGGFGIPSHIKREVRNLNPQLRPTKQQQQPSSRAATNGDDLISRGAPPLPATPTHNQLSADQKSRTSSASGVSDDDSSSVTTTSSVSPNEDTLSQHSSNGRGSHAYRPGSAPSHRNDHTHQSGSVKLHPQQFNDSYSAPTTPVKTSASQSHMLPTASSPRAPPQGAMRYTPGVQIPPSLQNGTSSTHSKHGGDYTQRIRYPNNSGIIIKPLTDDERTLHRGDQFAKTEDSIRVHEDPIAFLPADSSLYDFTLNEKQCPVCQHVFVTLTEKEFQSHVALCFK